MGSARSRRELGSCCSALLAPHCAGSSCRQGLHCGCRGQLIAIPVLSLGWKAALLPQAQSSVLKWMLWAEKAVQAAWGGAGPAQGASLVSARFRLALGGGFQAESDTFRLASLAKVCIGSNQASDAGGNQEDCYFCTTAPVTSIPQPEAWLSSKDQGWSCLPSLHLPSFLPPSSLFPPQHSTEDASRASSEQGRDAVAALCHSLPLSIPRSQPGDWRAASASGAELALLFPQNRGENDVLNICHSEGGRANDATQGVWLGPTACYATLLIFMPTSCLLKVLPFAVSLQTQPGLGHLSFTCHSAHPPARP